jgi:hypothetical protein
MDLVEFSFRNFPSSETCFSSFGVIASVLNHRSIGNPRWRAIESSSGSKRKIQLLFVLDFKQTQGGGGGGRFKAASTLWLIGDLLKHIYIQFCFQFIRMGSRRCIMYSDKWAYFKKCYANVFCSFST